MDQSERVMVLVVNISVVTSISQSHSVRNRNGVNLLWNYLNCSSWPNVYLTDTATELVYLSRFWPTFHSRWHHSQKNHQPFDSSTEKRVKLATAHTITRCALFFCVFLSFSVCHFESFFISRTFALANGSGAVCLFIYLMAKSSTGAMYFVVALLCFI